MTIFQLPFATFMMRISFEAVPRELDEAALIDGASYFAVLRRVLLPAVKPGIITVGLFAFLAHGTTSWHLLLQRHYVRGFISGALKG